MTASGKSSHPASNLAVKLDRQTGEIRAWAQLEVVDTFPNNDQITIEKAKEKYPDVQLGDVVEWEVTPKNLGALPRRLRARRFSSSSAKRKKPL
ncbi:MAG: NusA N-terminal domain-containing protein [Victivallales bacterium]